MAKKPFKMNDDPEWLREKAEEEAKHGGIISVGGLVTEIAAAEKMVENFQCPGCTCGSIRDCGVFKLKKVEGPMTGGFFCESHSAGTFLGSIGRIALGLPKGFNRYGAPYKGKPVIMGEISGAMTIRLWLKGTKPAWDKFNVPVWKALGQTESEKGYLFVRTYTPRINAVFTDVIQGRLS